MFAPTGLGDLGILPHHNGVVEDPRCHHTEAILSEMLSYQGNLFIPGCDSNFLDGLVVSVKSLRHKYPRYVRSDQTRRSRDILYRYWV